MATPVNILNNKGAAADVDLDQALVVSVQHRRSSSVNPRLLTATKQFSGFLSTGAGSIEMNVDGSSAPVLFLQPAAASTTITRYITRLRFIIHDGNLDITSAGNLRRFGDATGPNIPLTNGITLQVLQGTTLTDLLPSPIQTLSNFFDIADSTRSLPSAVSQGIDYFSADIVFAIPIVLPPGTTDRVILTVQDDLTAVDSMRLVARGYQDTL